MATPTEQSLQLPTSSLREAMNDVAPTTTVAPIQIKLRHTLPKHSIQLHFRLKPSTTVQRLLRTFWEYASERNPFLYDFITLNDLYIDIMKHGMIESTGMYATAQAMNSITIQDINLRNGDVLTVRSVFQAFPMLPKGCVLRIPKSVKIAPFTTQTPNLTNVGGTLMQNPNFLRVDDRNAFKYGPSSFEVQVTDIFSTTMTTITNRDLAKKLIGSRVRALRPRVHPEENSSHEVVVVVSDLVFKIREKGFSEQEALKAFSYTNNQTRDNMWECWKYVSELYHDGHLKDLKSTTIVDIQGCNGGNFPQKICLNMKDVSKLMQIVYPTLIKATETAMTTQESSSISVDHQLQATHGQVPFLTLDLNAKPLEDTSTPQKFDQLFKIHMRDIPSASTIGIDDRDDRKIRFMHMPQGPLYCMTDIANFVYNSNGKRSLDRAWNVINGKDEDDGSTQHGFLKFQHGRVELHDVFKMCIGLNPQGTGSQMEYFCAATTLLNYVSSIFPDMGNIISGLAADNLGLNGGAKAVESMARSAKVLNSGETHGFGPSHDGLMETTVSSNNPTLLFVNLIKSMEDDRRADRDEQRRINDSMFAKLEEMSVDKITNTNKLIANLESKLTELTEKMDNKQHGAAIEPLFKRWTDAEEDALRLAVCKHSSGSTVGSVDWPKVMVETQTRRTVGALKNKLNKHLYWLRTANIDQTPPVTRVGGSAMSVATERLLQEGRSVKRSLEPDFETPEHNKQIKDVVLAAPKILARFTGGVEDGTPWFEARAIKVIADDKRGLVYDIKWSDADTRDTVKHRRDIALIQSIAREVTHIYSRSKNSPWRTFEVKWDVKYDGKYITTDLSEFDKDGTRCIDKELIDAYDQKRSAAEVLSSGFSLATRRSMKTPHNYYESPPRY